MAFRQVDKWKCPLHFHFASLQKKTQQGTNFCRLSFKKIKMYFWLSRQITVNATQWGPFKCSELLSSAALRYQPFTLARGKN